MGWKNKRDFQAYRERKSKRYSEFGRDLESKVEKLLEELKVKGYITKYKRHRPHSVADGEGKDFTIWTDKHEKSFGVTISLKSWRESQMKYPEIPQFCFPLNVNLITIERRILELVKNESDPV